VPLHPALENAYPLLLHAMATLPHLLGAAGAAAGGSGSGGGSRSGAGGGGGGGGGGAAAPYAACAAGGALAGAGAELAARALADPSQVTRGCRAAPGLLAQPRARPLLRSAPTQALR
jgi:hypothetical protein